MKISANRLGIACFLGFALPSEAQIRSDRPELKLVTQEQRGLADLRFRGSNPTFRLGQCEGDCDGDSDCLSGLVCYRKSSGGSGQVPGCNGRDTTSHDFCIDPADANLPPTGSPPTAPAPTAPAPSSPRTALFSYGSNPPSSVLPLGICEGDCDDDGDCDPGLRCLQRGSNSGAVPGCNGSDSRGTDYCVSSGGGPTPSPPGPSPTTPTNTGGLENFKLKMYWEEGYFWQDEQFERKWCMRCRGGSCSIGEKLYIEECSDSGVERFDFVFDGSDEVLIRLHGTNRCLERASRDIFVQNCNSGNSLQRWWAKEGDFDGSRFEISQLGATNLCITQRHHPKSGEEVELESCTTARSDDTSYWERCNSNSC